MENTNITETVLEYDEILLIDDYNMKNGCKEKFKPKHPILGIFFCILSAIIVIGCIVFIIKIPVCEECREKTTNILFQKQYEMLHSFFDITDLKTGYIVLGSLFLIGISGTMADIMDDALCLLPFGRIIRNRTNVKIPMKARYVPALILTVYFTTLFVTSELSELQLSKDVEYEITSFSWIGQGYTAGMWFTQISIGLTLISMALLTVEAFSQSGVWGLLLRVPLMIFSNIALAISISCFMTIGIVVFVTVAIFGLILLAFKNLKF